MLRSLSLVLVVGLVLVAVAGAAGCDTPLGQEAAELVSEEQPRTASDSSIKAWEAARDAMEQPAADAVLLTAGTQGVALADVPDSWSFTFFSPSEGKLWRVAVDHGKAQAPEAMGEAQKDVDTSQAIPFDSIEVGAAEAVGIARESGSKTGAVPPNVLVSGTFVEMPEAADLGFRQGMWAVTFLEGTSTEGSREFMVDMMSGAAEETH